MILKIGGCHWKDFSAENVTNIVWRAHPLALEELTALPSWILGRNPRKREKRKRRGKGRTEMEQRKKENVWENGVNFSLKWAYRKI